MAGTTSPQIQSGSHSYNNIYSSADFHGSASYICPEVRVNCMEKRIGVVSTRIGFMLQS